MIELSLVSGWRKLVLCTALFAFACNRENANAPARPVGQIRTTLPRLTGFGEWHACKSRDEGAVADADCGPANIPPHLVSLAVGECDREMSRGTSAVALLAWVPQCTDAAVERLAAAAAPRNDATALSDLAAAYYVRAQRNEQPSDLVRSLDAADAALSLDSDHDAARFNQALALEILGFSDDAIAAWESVRRDGERGWSGEAESRQVQLTRERTLSASLQWPLNVRRLPLVAKAGDRKAVETLVSPYRAAAQRWIEEEILPRWASTTQMEVAEEQLALAEMVAEALERLTRDPYLRESVQQIRTSESEPLRRGILAFRDARLAEQRLDFNHAGPLYAAAEPALAAVGSPLRFGAVLGRVTALTFAGHYDQALTLLDSVERDGRRYPHLLARVHTGRGFVDMVQGDHADAISDYGKAADIFGPLRDTENLAKLHYRRVGLFRTVGHEDLTWREMFQALRAAPALSDPQSRHAFLGESASSAAALGYPGVALRYQDTAVQLLREALSRSSDADAVGMRRNLGIALRARASIRVRLRDVDSARKDLEEADRLIVETEQDNAIVRGLRARLTEAEAQTLEKTDRPRALALLTEAIEHASATHYLTLSASLLTQRADLHRINGQRSAAVSDLRRAIAALRQEERKMLSHHAENEIERIWSAYFARYQEAYRQLIALLVEDGADAEAFAYAEKARAYEPLHRVLQRDDVPDAFRETIRGGEPLALEDAKRMLPDGTFLLEYVVLEDRTFVWLIWNGGAERRTLRAGNAAIAEWTAALQRLADTRERDGWLPALQAPYDAFLAEPIARIAKIHRGDALPRVIVVPDRAMHGLPFAALHDGRRHLIQNHRVSVAASATLYAFSLEQDRQLSRRGAGPVLIVADPLFDEDLDVAQGLPKLRMARAEAADIARIYQEVADVPEPLLAEKATIPAFLKLAGSSTIIHIASHGVAIPNVPSQSFLLLAPAGNDSGVLDAERLIAELHLDRTRLVVLSACSTAGGTRIGPEGLAPLVRPLVAAGVPGVVGTLWQVDDNVATAELLVRFHQYYRDGADADDALGRAQREMLESNNLARNSPRIWAPFQFTGHASSPFAPRLTQTRR